MLTIARSPWIGSFMARSLEACSYKEQTAADNKVVVVKKTSLAFFPPLQLKKCAVVALVFFFHGAR